MKQNPTQGTRVRAPFKLYPVIFLTIFSLAISKSSSAHIVRYFTVPCFTQGQTTAIVVQPWITNAGVGTWYRWEYRIGSTGTWTVLNNGLNTINGHSFNVLNAFLPNHTISYNATGALLTPSFSITNSGSPFNTQLDNIQLRILMKDGADPATHTGTIYGGEEFTNAFEAKYINLRSKPNNESCYANCSANSLVDIPSTNPSLESYYGGFEKEPYTSANFFTPNGTTQATNATTDLVQWTGGSSTDKYRILNNPDSMNTAFSAFAPHSGKTMMVVNANNSCTDRVWYRTIVVPLAGNFYFGAISFKAWVAKVNATNPTFVLELKGATTITGTSYTSISSVTQTISGTIGSWVQLSMPYNFTPPHFLAYKKLEISIKAYNTTATCSTTPVSFALDDLCLIEPSNGPLPVIMSPLKGSYANGVSHLNWSTYQEINTSHFEIERSSDGVNYTFLTRVNAKANSDRQIDYSFNDIKVNDGTNFYRLKEFDLDGSFRYSNIIVLNVSIKGTFITAIYPSPFSDKINISLSSETKDFATILLFDKAGRQLASRQATVNKGVNTITLNNLESLARGFYIVKVQVGDDIVLTQKLIK